MRYPSELYERKLGARVYNEEEKKKRADQREQEDRDRLEWRQKRGTAVKETVEEIQDLLNPVIGGLKAASDTSGQAANYYFLVDVVRGQGKNLGLEFDMQGRVTHLGTEETSIGVWNRIWWTMFPDAAVQLGDIIVSVNESRDICEMQSLISKDNITSFELLVRSERDGPLVGGGGSSDQFPM